MEDGMDESEESIRELIEGFSGRVDVILVDMKSVPVWLVRIFSVQIERRGELFKIGVTEEALGRYFSSLSIPYALYRDEERMFCRTGTEPNVDTKDLKRFLKVLKQFSGSDFTSYALGGVERVVKGMMRKNGMDSFLDFEEKIFQSREFYCHFIDAMSIGHTSFFRDREFYRILRENVIKRLAVHPHFKVWSAGCSGGMEPYSIAMLLMDEGLLGRGVVYATDFNEISLREAKNGLYSMEEFESMLVAYREMGGEGEPEEYFINRGGYVEVDSKIRDKVNFFRHDLTIDSSFNTFELILCRNVLIYFEDSLKKRVLKLLHDSMAHNGFLCLGSTEGIHHYLDKVNFVQYKNGINIYRKAIKGIRKAGEHETF
ncbi:MAG TPA: CheR family methyltransferase [Clostridia bacterium]|nr:CheR family methyltransferase [Clostridia bacterium]